MNLILLVGAILCLAVATLLGFDVFDEAHYSGWLALGLVLFAASHLPWPTFHRE